MSITGGVCRFSALGSWAGSDNPNPGNHSLSSYNQGMLSTWIARCKNLYPLSREIIELYKKYIYKKLKLDKNHVMFAVLGLWLNLWLCDITSPWLHKLLTESLGTFHVLLCWVFCIGTEAGKKVKIHVLCGVSEKPWTRKTSNFRWKYLMFRQVLIHSSNVL